MNAHAFHFYPFFFHLTSQTSGTYVAEKGWEFFGLGPRELRLFTHVTKGCEDKIFRISCGHGPKTMTGRDSRHFKKVLVIVHSVKVHLDWDIVFLMKNFQSRKQVFILTKM